MRTKPLQSIQSTLAVLEELKSRRTAGVSELADALDASKSTVHRHLVTLQDEEYVVKDGDEYRLRLRFLNLGGEARRNYDLFDVARPEVDYLANETGETVKLSVEEYGLGTYIYIARGEKAVMTDVAIGKRLHLHCTAFGKCILAHLPDERVAEILDTQGLPAVSANTITDREELLAELGTIKERGCAFDNGERLQGCRCVAAPITTDDGVLGALSIGGTEKRIDETRFTQTLPELIQQTAREIELNAMYS